MSSSVQAAVPLLESDDGPVPSEELEEQEAADEGDDDDVKADSEGEDEDAVSYQESERFKTWRKHVKDLYQTSVHIDTVWESPPAQFMPFITHKPGEHIAVQTILCGTRTGGAEQNYLQLATVSLPTDASQIEEVGFHETTGEVGGYGMAPAQCAFRIERRMAHSGDVLAARYMHANPLVLGSCSSDGNVYIFDWSRISLTRAPNKPERPLGPLPPNAITEMSTAEEKAAYHRRMGFVQKAWREQSIWDKKTHSPQHVLGLAGSHGVPTTMDFNTTVEGRLVAGSNGRVCMWNIGQLPKDVIPKQEKSSSSTTAPAPPMQPLLDPQWTFSDPRTEEAGAQPAQINDVKFRWGGSDVVFAASQRGVVFQGDLRQPGMNEFCVLPAGVGATCLAVPYLDNDQLVFVGSTDGHLRTFDIRRPGQLSVGGSIQCHVGDVTVAQCCPHAGDMIATGGEDGYCALFSLKQQQAVSKDEGSSRLLFKHSAHVSTVTDINWNWQDMFAGHIVSADSTSMTVWKPREMFLTSL